ncbi:hypothetical protein IWX90DRAFT_489437 [Phyllosticta citrichinensis]|uniref:DUF4604 domain-containing protein n=1 Tax=Phyllosticta citrichinensis TaxID=1130410 RepID=A0ABR1XJG8_9PEZI
MAFNAKNLSYDRSEPAFLRRLKGEATAGRDTDRHERPAIRPRGQARQSANDDADDAPTYVLEESGDALSKAEYEALVSPGAGAATGATDATAAAATSADGSGPKQEDGQQLKDASAKKKPQQVASVGGASKKRKAVKIGHDEDEQNEDEASKEPSSWSLAGVGAANKPDPKHASSASKQPKPKKTKRAKAKVALSFGDDVEAAE